MLVYGKNVLKEAIDSSYKINEVCLIKDFNDKEIIALLEKNNIPFRYLEKREFSKYNFNHQGIIVKMEDIRKTDLKEFLEKDRNKSLIVILDHIEDPHNFGAIIRTCEALGVDLIIVPKNRSVSINETVVKTSAGSLFNMNFCEHNLHQALLELSKNNYQIIGSDMDGIDFNDINYNEKVVIILGNEGRGISHLLKENSDIIAKIPMYGKVNSLNVSVAAGLFINKVKEKQG